MSRAHALDLADDGDGEGEGEGDSDDGGADSGADSGGDGGGCADGGGHRHHHHQRIGLKTSEIQIDRWHSVSDLSRRKKAVRLGFPVCSQVKGPLTV